MCLIEFSGLPGSGKSTIREKLIAVLRKEGHSQCISAEEAFLSAAQMKGDFLCSLARYLLPPSWRRSMAPRLYNRTPLKCQSQNHFLASHGIALNAFFNSMAYLYMNEEDKFQVIEAFLLTGALFFMAKEYSRKQDIIFFEEGLIQKSLMFLWPEAISYDAQAVEAYMNAIPFPDILIHVKAEPETCKKRMLSRPQGVTQRLKNSTPKTIGLFFQQIENHLNKIYSYVDQHTTTTAWTTANMKPVDETVAELAQTVLKLSTDLQK